jgi:hypothetical protein
MFFNLRTLFKDLSCCNFKTDDFQKVDEFSLKEAFSGISCKKPEGILF